MKYCYLELPYLYLTTTVNKEFTGKSLLTSFCAKSSEKKKRAEAPYFTNWKVLWKLRSLRIILGFLKEELQSTPIQDSIHELIIWKVNLFVTSVTCRRYQIAFKWSMNFWLQFLVYDGMENISMDEISIQTFFKFRKTEPAEISWWTRLCIHYSLRKQKCCLRADVFYFLCCNNNN